MQYRITSYRFQLLRGRHPLQGAGLFLFLNIFVYVVIAGRVVVRLYIGQYFVAFGFNQCGVWVRCYVLIQHHFPRNINVFVADPVKRVFNLYNPVLHETLNVFDAAGE